MRYNILKYILFIQAILSIAFLYTGCKASHSSIVEVKIVGGNVKDNPVIYFSDGTQMPVKLDTTGCGSLIIENESNIYVKLGYEYTTRLLWIAPNSQTHISFNKGEFSKSVIVEGSNSNVNNYLNRKLQEYATIDDTILDEAAFIAKCDSLLQKNLDVLNRAELPEEFVKKERARLPYYTFQILPSYKYFHSKIAKEPDFEYSDIFWNKIRELTIYKSDYLCSEDYQQFIVSAASILSKKEFPQLVGIQRFTSYIDKFVKDFGIAEFLINKRVYSYIKKSGLDEAQEYMAAFKKYVADANMIAEMEALQTKVRMQSKGAISPDFNCVDITGKQYSLKDFKGKYLYIDVWATWCAPCRKEMPYIEKLKEKFAGKEICFVGISCDNNKSVWENFITYNKAKGIQLYLTEGNTFMDDYMITGIPRFILLDKGGYIISNKMTAPSDPQTAIYIETLLQ